MVNVSTHSRPKAAGNKQGEQQQGEQFQHTAARRRLVAEYKENFEVEDVSTHSRPKAAG